MATRTTEYNIAFEFLDSLFGQAIEDGSGLIGIWTKDNKQTHFFDSTDKAATFAIKRSAETDVYVAVCLQPPGLPSDTRAKADQVTAMCGFWADIDIGRAETGKTYPPDIITATDIVAEVGISPSHVVQSGGGMHAWWLLNEPWGLSTTEERQRAASVATFAVSRLAINGKNLAERNSSTSLKR